MPGHFAGEIGLFLCPYHFPRRGTCEFSWHCGCPYRLILGLWHVIYGDFHDIMNLLSRGNAVQFLYVPMTIFREMSNCNVAWSATFSFITGKCTCAQLIFPPEAAITRVKSPMNMFLSLHFVEHHFLPSLWLSSIPFLGYWVWSSIIFISKKVDT